MHIVFTENNGDFDGPVLDIYFHDKKEAFELGRIFEKIVNAGRCVWLSKIFIRIPLVEANEIGMVKIKQADKSEKE
jgi:hypothetical protein